VISELSGGGREEEEREDENAGTGNDDGRGPDPEQSHRTVSDEDREGILEKIVVEGAQKLGPEERPEATLGQQVELAQPVLPSRSMTDHSLHAIGFLRVDTGRLNPYSPARRGLM
jgi:hypothetical protein